jgi:hypothetical protein
VIGVVPLGYQLYFRFQAFDYLIHGHCHLILLCQRAVHGSQQIAHRVSGPSGSHIHDSP